MFSQTCCDSSQKNTAINGIVERNQFKTDLVICDSQNTVLRNENLVLTNLNKRSEQRFDSVAFIANNEIQDKKNLENNCRKQIANEKKKAAIKNIVLEILIPVVILETLFILKK